MGTFTAVYQCAHTSFWILIFVFLRHFLMTGLMSHPTFIITRKFASRRSFFNVTYVLFQLTLLWTHFLLQFSNLSLVCLQHFAQVNDLKILDFNLSNESYDAYPSRIYQSKYQSKARKYFLTLINEVGQLAIKLFSDQKDITFQVVFISTRRRHKTFGKQVKEK